MAFIRLSHKILLSVLCAGFFLVIPVSGQIQKTICLNEDIDDGYVVVSDKVAKPERCRVGLDGVLIRKPGEIEVICGNSPVPPEYRVEGKAYSRDCHVGYVIGIRLKEPSARTTPNPSTTSPSTAPTSTRRPQGQTREEESGQTTICMDERIPAGFVIVLYTRKSSCRGGFSNNAYLIRRPNEKDEVCDISPIPSSHEIIGTGTSKGCAKFGDWNEIGKTKIIQRKALVATTTGRDTSAVEGRDTGATYSDWLNERDFKNLCVTMARRRSYPVHIRGRKDPYLALEEYRAFFIPFPHDSFDFQYVLGIDYDTFSDKHDELARRGYKIVSYQAFTDSKNISLYQAVWVK